MLNRTRAVLVSDPTFDPGRPHRFTIGQTDGSIPILVALMERLRNTAPNIELHVRRVDADGVIGAIDRQELDLGFAVMPSARPIARIVRVPVLNVRYVCIARRDHPALRKPRVAGGIRGAAAYRDFAARRAGELCRWAAGGGRTAAKHRPDHSALSGRTADRRPHRSGRDHR